MPMRRVFHVCSVLVETFLECVVGASYVSVCGVVYIFELGGVDHSRLLAIACKGAFGGFTTVA